MVLKHVVKQRLSKSGSQRRRRPMAMVARLKPERVQLALAAAAGWKVRSKGRALSRLLKFPDPASASAYAAYAARIASGSRRVSVAMMCSHTTVGLVVRGCPKTEGESLDRAVLEVALKLG